MISDARLAFDAGLLFQYAQNEFSRILVTPRDRAPYNAWGWSFLCEALLNSYRRTLSSQHLELVQAAVEHVFSQRDSDRGIIDPRFGVPRETWGINVEGDWATVVTTPGRIVAPSLDLLMLTGMRGDILDKSIAAVETCLPDFVSLGEEGLFARPAKGDWEPLNHAVSLGRALLRLAKMTGDERYANVVHQLARFFKGSLVLEEESYYGWAYRPNPENRRRGYPTNYWKADIDLAFVVDCYKEGIVFGESDIALFVETLKRGVIRPDFLNCKVANKKAAPLREKAEKIGVRAYGLCGWMVLAEFDDEVEGLIEKALSDHADVMTGGWFGVPHAAWGYSFKR